MARLALFSGLLTSAAGHAFLFASFPLLGRQLGLEDIQTGALLSLGALGLLVTAPFWGWLSERWGRRPVLLIGLGMAALAPLLYAAVAHQRLSGALTVAAAFALLLAVRLSQAVMTSGLLPAAQAFMADVTSAERRTGGMGMMAASFGLGGIAGAGILWAVSATGILNGFYLIAGFTLLAAVLCWLRLPEPRRRKPKGQPSGSLPWRSIWPQLLTTLIGVAAYSLLQQVTGLRLQDLLGLTPQQAAAQAGAVLTTTAVAMVVAQGVILQRLRWPPGRLVAIGAALATSALIVLALSDLYPLLVAAMMVTGLSLGLLLPANLALLSLRAPAGSQGKAAGVNAVGQGLAMAAGPIAGAALYQLSPAAPYAAAAVLLAGVGVLAVLLADRRPASPSADSPQSEKAV